MAANPADPVLTDLDLFWGNRERLLRTIRRWDGPAIAFDLFEACAVTTGCDERRAFQKALERLVTEGLVVRRPFVSYAYRTGYFDPQADGARFEYEAAPWTRPARGFFEAIRVYAERFDVGSRSMQRSR